MSYLVAASEFLVAAASDLAGVGSAVTAANAAAAVSTTQIAAAGQDQVSAAITGVFGSYAQQYRALIAQAGLFHDQFVQALNTGAGAYMATEAANAGPLQTARAEIAQDVQTVRQDIQLVIASARWRRLRQLLNRPPAA